MTDRAFLPMSERVALQAAIAEIVRVEGSQQAAGNRLGVSQQAIGKAINGAHIGPMTARKVCDHFGLDMQELVAKFGRPISVADAESEFPPAARQAMTQINPRPRAISMARVLATSEWRKQPLEWWRWLFTELDYVAKRAEERAGEK